MMAIPFNQQETESQILGVIQNATPVPVHDHSGGDGGDGNDPREKTEKRRRDCPVRPLGFVDRTFYYLCPTGEVCGLSGGKHNKLEILALFGAHKNYLWESGPATTRKAYKPDGTPAPRLNS